MGSFSKGTSSKQSSSSRVEYPYEFLNAYTNAVGRPFSVTELLGAIPQTQGLFTRGSSGTVPTAGGAPTGGGGAGAPGGGGGGGAAGGGAAAPPAGLSLGELGDIVGRGGRPQLANQITQAFMQGARKMGLDPTDPNARFTYDQVQQAVNAGKPGLTNLPYWATVATGINQAQGAAQQPQTPRFQTSTPELGIDFLGGVDRLGFGQAPNRYDPATIRELPQINAPTVQAAQANLAPEGFDRFEQALFRSQFNPVRDELERQGSIQDRQLQAELAQRGLGGSGTTQNALTMQRRDRSQQLTQAASEAADRATTQRYGMEFTQAQQNAERQQQANLAQAGYDFNAQVTNAQNILAGDTARADNYLKTMGLNEETAKAGRQDFLALAGLTEQDLQRMDNQKLQGLGVILNTYLQQAALLGNLGQVSTGKGEAGGGWGVSVLNILGGTAQSG